LAIVVAGYARDDIYADWTRGEVIRRLPSGATVLGLLHFAPKQGKTSRMLTGDSLSTASHASPHFATPQTPAALYAASSMGGQILGRCPQRRRFRRKDRFDEGKGGFASTPIV